MNKLRIQPVSTEAEWQAAQEIRTHVFIEEQACPPELEWDEFDATSRHVLGWVGDQPVATARWRVVQLGGRQAAKLERFAVLASYRGHGYGRRLVAYVMNEAVSHGYHTLLLYAQAHLEGFYNSFGFEAFGEPFEEAGIPHIKMQRERSSVTT